MHLFNSIGGELKMKIASSRSIIRYTFQETSATGVPITRTRYGGANWTDFEVDASRFKCLQFGSFGTSIATKEQLFDNASLYPKASENDYSIQTKRLKKYLNSSGGNTTGCIAFVGVCSKNDFEMLPTQNKPNNHSTTNAIYFNNDGGHRDTPLENGHKTATAQDVSFPFQTDYGQTSLPNHILSVNNKNLIIQNKVNRAIGYGTFVNTNSKYIRTLMDKIDSLLTPELIVEFDDLCAITMYSIMGNNVYIDATLPNSNLAKLLDLHDKIKKSDDSNSYDVGYISVLGNLEAVYVLEWMLRCCEDGKILKDDVINDDDPNTHSDVINYKYYPQGRLGKFTFDGWNWASTTQDFNINTARTKIYVKTALPGAIETLLADVPYTTGEIDVSLSSALEKIDPNLLSRLAMGWVDSTLSYYVQFKIQTIASYNGASIERRPCYVQISASGEVESYWEDSDWIQNLDTIEIKNISEYEPNESTPSTTSHDSITGSDPSESGLGLLTTTYAVSPTELKEIGSVLWNDDFFSNIKLLNNSPIENIVSCKMYPIAFTGDTASVVIGNVDMNVNGGKLTNANYSKTVTSGEITIPRTYKNFLDYEPYTKINLYIPFIGFVPLECGLAYNGTLKLKWTFDIVEGGFTCALMSGNRVMKIFNGTCGIDIPITASNRAQVEASYIRSALVGVGGAFAHNPLVIAGSVLSCAEATNHSATVGKISNNCGVSQPLTPYVIVDNPIYNSPTTYGRDKGFICNGSYTLSDLEGYTVMESLELKGIKCTESERNEIEKLLKSGVYLPKKETE